MGLGVMRVTYGLGVRCPRISAGGDVPLCISAGPQSGCRVARNARRVRQDYTTDARADTPIPAALTAGTWVRSMAPKGPLSGLQVQIADGLTPPDLTALGPPVVV